MLLLSMRISVVYVSTFLVGGIYIAIVALTSARLTELLDSVHFTTWWGYFTAGFALTQAGSGYLMSYLLQFQNGYFIIFLMATLGFFVGFCLLLSCFFRLYILKPWFAG